MTTNAVYGKAGTAVTFKASGGSVLFTPTSVANAAGRLSTRGDLGALPRPLLYRWYAETAAAATPTVGNWLEIRMAWWNDDATPGQPDGGVGASDAAFATENDLKNLKKVGEVVCDAASATVFQASGLIWIPVRYVSVVWWNRFGSALSATAGDHVFSLTPVFDDIQAAA